MRKLLSVTPAAAADIIRQWLIATMHETGMTAPVWAKRANLAPSTIQRALRPDDTFVTSSRTLAKLAAVANRPVPALNSTEQTRVEAVFLRVRHKVQGGTWLEMDYNGQIELAPPRPVAPDPRWIGVEQWLELVVGDSIDKEIPDGAFAHVVDAIGLRYEPRAGDFVVVERVRGGLLRERTIKQVVITAGGVVELHPRSSNTRHRPLILTDGAALADDIKVQIVGRVVGSYRTMG